MQYRILGGSFTIIFCIVLLCFSVLFVLRMLPRGADLLEAQKEQKNWWDDLGSHCINSRGTVWESHQDTQPYDAHLPVVKPKRKHKDGWQNLLARQMTRENSVSNDPPPPFSQIKQGGSTLHPLTRQNPWALRAGPSQGWHRSCRIDSLKESLPHNTGI